MIINNISSAHGIGRLTELLERSIGYQRVKRVFADLGLPLALSDMPNMSVPLNALIEVFENAGEASGDRCFGLRVSMDMGHGFGRPRKDFNWTISFFGVTYETVSLTGR